MLHSQLCKVIQDNQRFYPLAFLQRTIQKNFCNDYKTCIRKLLIKEILSFPYLSYQITFLYEYKESKQQRSSVLNNLSNKESVIKNIIYKEIEIHVS